MAHATQDVLNRRISLVIVQCLNRRNQEIWLRARHVQFIIHISRVVTHWLSTVYHIETYHIAQLAYITFICVKWLMAGFIKQFLSGTLHQFYLLCRSSQNNSKYIFACIPQSYRP